MLCCVYRRLMWILWLLCPLLAWSLGHGEKISHVQIGPSFIVEPPGKVRFYNSTGTVIPCSASGVAQPKISWTKQDGTMIPDISGLRHVRPDGSLVFPPFRAEEYRQDIHAAVYRCSAKNGIGNIGSRDVHVRAVIRIKYEVRTQDDFTMKGNTALLKCFIPSSVKDFVSVISWETNDAMIIQKDQSEKVRVISDGSLVIESATALDGRRKYRCITRDELDRETIVSSTWGQLIVTEPTATLPPRIRSGKREIRYQVGQTSELLCISQGNPVPTYRWFKKEGNHLVPLLFGQHYRLMGSSLLIERSGTHDSGTYICVANNSLGEDRAQYQVFITEPLKISLYPKSLKVKEATGITLHCNVSGHLVTSVVWTKDLKPIMSSSRIKLGGSKTLQIFSVQREDKGMYQCFARTAEESAQGTAEVTLEEDPPEFKEVFSDQILRPGSRTSLRCVVEGNPLPQVSWYLYNTPIIEGLAIRIGDFVDGHGLLTSFINLTSVKVDDGGSYTCIARNEIGTIRHSAKISVFGPPLVHPMANITVVAGDEVWIDCATSGYPIKSIKWKKDNNYLARLQRLTDHQNGTVSLLQAAKADEGWYQCEANGNGGERADGSFYLKIIEKPVINPFLFGEDLREGMRTMVVCSVLSGEPPIIITWLKNNVPLTIMHRDVQIASLGEFASSLTISSVNRKHAGNYSCRATSGAASATYTAPMAVRASPKWIKQPEDIAAVLGIKVVFLCQAEGIPDPVHRWKYALGSSSGPSDFKSIVSSSHMYVLENGSLVITDAEKDDEGFYLCEASNGIGSPLSAVVQLRVNVPPRYNHSFEIKTVREGEEVFLTCNAFGDTPLIISWKRYQRPIDRSALSRYVLREHVHMTGLNSQLWISSVIKSDSGLFTCEASNEYGKDERSIQLVVQSVPDPPGNIQLLQVTSRVVSLSWVPPASGNSPITGYIVVFNKSKGQKDKRETVVKMPSTENKVTANGLDPGTTYVFRVHAENMLGKSIPSEDFTVNTEEEAPSGIPVDVVAVATSTTTIKVTWKSPPKTTYQGDLLGYYVGCKEYGSTEPFLYKTVDLQKDKETETVLTNLRKNTKYVIAVQAFNNKGAGPAAKEIVVHTLEHDPPKSPLIRVSSKASTSVDLEWDRPEKDLSVTGYILHYKSESEEWQETHISQQRNKHSMRNLRCGTRYQFTLTAFNAAGRGDPSDVISVQTTGGAPIAPDRKALLSINSSFVNLRLSSWNDGGCPIEFFVVQYKPQLHKEWILLSNHILPDQAAITVPDLVPGSWYDLLMAAHNDAGSTEAEFRFATLTLSGATVPPLAASTSNSGSILRDPAVLVPIICAIVVVVVITIVVAVVIVLRRKEPTSDCRSQGVYSNSSGGKGENLSMSSYGKVKRSDPSDDAQRESLYYPTPYATTQLATYSDSPSINAHCNTLKRQERKGRDHEYDVPHRHPQSDDYTCYAKLWTHARPPIQCLPQPGNADLPIASSRSVKQTSFLESYGTIESDSEDIVQLTTPTTDVGDIDELSETECDRHRDSWSRIRDIQHRRSFGEHLYRSTAHVC